MVNTLYETIGGRAKLNAAVDLFYQKVLADEKLRGFFDGVNMDHLRARQSMFVSMLLGGKVVYTGKNIHEAHRGAREMGLTDAHFDPFLKHFQAALEEVGVPAEKVAEIIKLLEDSRDAVLKPTVPKPK